MTTVRKGQAPAHSGRDAFGRRFREPFLDPTFQAEAPALDRIEAIAWSNYSAGRKAAVTRKAGPGYEDPEYDLAVEWIEARAEIDKAQAAWADGSAATRALVICGST